MVQKPQFPAAKATIFRLSQESDRQAYEAFLAELMSYEVFDTFEDQVAELLVTRNPQLRSNP